MDLDGCMYNINIQEYTGCPTSNRVNGSKLRFGGEIRKLKIMFKTSVWRFTTFQIQGYFKVSLGLVVMSIARHGWTPHKTVGWTISARFSYFLLFIKSYPRLRNSFSNCEYWKVLWYHMLITSGLSFSWHPLYVNDSPSRQ